jgi:ketosteroid isomerase-like protein
LGLCPAAMSRFDIQSVRLITADVALVDAVNELGFSASQPINGQRAPLHSRVLLVLRKEGDAWKIASLRVMAQAEPAAGQ